MSGCEDGSQLLLPWTGQPSLTSSNISFFDGPTIILQAVEQYLDGKWAEVSFYPEAGVGPPKDQSRCPRGRELSTASIVRSVPIPTLDKPGGHWTCAYRNILP